MPQAQTIFLLRKDNIGMSEAFSIQHTWYYIAFKTIMKTIFVLKEQKILFSHSKFLLAQNKLFSELVPSENSCRSCTLPTYHWGGGGEGNFGYLYLGFFRLLFVIREITGGKKIKLKSSHPASPNKAVKY
jgi:hypothetical protein